MLDAVIIVNLLCLTNSLDLIANTKMLAMHISLLVLNDAPIVTRRVSLVEQELKASMVLVGLVLLYRGVRKNH
jgi:hypothetical protein